MLEKFFFFFAFQVIVSFDTIMQKPREPFILMTNTHLDKRYKYHLEPYFDWTRIGENCVS